ncbi:MAG TPA: glycoside hydrolase family 43 protein, partial [Clostridia bacterium]|nr:glycoside hydrolase family 43 protein [Clostridia bacterium]
MENHPHALYANPLSIQGIGDPFVLRAEDGLYYCYPTSAKDGYKAWRSADLCSWEPLDYVFRRKEGDWCQKTFWAPEVLEAKGKYYMYYTSRDGLGHLQIGVAIASAPSGPFEDIGAPILSGDFSMIDASPFMDEDGAAYLFFVRDCSENVVKGIHESHIYGVRMNGDLVSVAGEPALLTVPEQAWEAREGTDWRWNEGPFVRKREGLYYLQYSANHFASPAYALGVAVAKSPLGPYEKVAYNPVLSAVERDGKFLVSGPGHHSVIESPDGTESFAVYHAHTDPANPSGNRQVYIDRMGYHADGTWFVGGPTLAPQPLPSG